MDGELFCVDIFARPDGTFGYEEYRRDPEDPAGWYMIGHHGDANYDSAEAAYEDAVRSVAWLAPSFGDGLGSRPFRSASQENQI